jgi:radical SAM protein with 4Fe4S-binding SPASM domain
MTIKTKLAKLVGYGNALKIQYLFAKPKPTEIIVDICAACNAKCPFCPRIYMPEERAKGYMTMELFEQTLIEAKRHGIERLRLYSTAEPTLHPDFEAFIAMAKNMGFYIAVSTNASLLDKYSKALMQVDLLQYSIEGWDKESYEKYRHPLKYDKVYRNIQHFHDARLRADYSPQVVTNLLLTRKTDMSAYFKCWAEFVDQINIHFMLEAVLFESGKFISRKSESIGDEYFDFDQQKKHFMCGYPFNTLTVAFDGKIALCCNDFSASLPMGHINDGIEIVFDSEVHNAIRKEFYQQKLDVCAGCSIFKTPKPEDVTFVREAIAGLDTQYREKANF